MRTFLIRSSIALCFLLAACGNPKAGKLSIRFIGIGTGSLKTPVEQIQFRNSFGVRDQELVAVVAFDSIQNGTTVQATWFAPDERRMPLGRTKIETQSGAKIARFSFASREPWQPAPFQLRIDAMIGEGDKQRTASGSMSFFIGMTQREIEQYKREFSEWTRADAVHRAEVETRIAAENAVVERAKTFLKSKDASLVFRRDFTGDGMDEFLIVSTGKDDSMPAPGGGQGVLASGEYDQFLLTDQSGTSLLALRRNRRIRSVTAGNEVILPKLTADGLVTVTVLPSGTFSLFWQQKKTMCTLELRMEAPATFAAADPVCR